MSAAELSREPIGKPRTCSGLGTSPRKCGAVWIGSHEVAATALGPNGPTTADTAKANTTETDANRYLPTIPSLSSRRRGTYHRRTVVQSTLTECASSRNGKG